MNLDLATVGGGLLVVSQFTLAADTSRGNRPGFSGAADAELGRALYERALATARRLHGDVACGEFGADMQVQPRQRRAGHDPDHAARLSALQRRSVGVLPGRLDDRRPTWRSRLDELLVLGAAERARR